MTEPQTVTIGGHRVQDTGQKYGIAGHAVVLWRCVDCEDEASSTAFTTGTEGCPARPASLDYLSLCPGGEMCPGHMAHDTPEYRDWKESRTMTSDQVPRRYCDEALTGIRAARHWLDFADRIGMKMRVWSPGGLAEEVDSGGGVVAGFQHASGDHYHVLVTRGGKLRAHTGREHACPACAELIAKGEIVA